jgi:hypothetical protein
VSGHWRPSSARWPPITASPGPRSNSVSSGRQSTEDTKYYGLLPEEGDQQEAVGVRDPCAKDRQTAGTRRQHLVRKEQLNGLVSSNYQHVVSSFSALGAGGRGFKSPLPDPSPTTENQRIGRAGGCGFEPGERRGAIGRRPVSTLVTLKQPLSVTLRTREVS